MQTILTLSMGLQKISNHYPWPEDTLERVRAIAYKFNPAWFEEKTVGEPEH
jgi:hypothetical protein